MLLTEILDEFFIQISELHEKSWLDLVAYLTNLSRG
jgi:hypothetical protein